MSINEKRSSYLASVFLFHIMNHMKEFLYEMMMNQGNYYWTDLGLADKPFVQVGLSHLSHCVFKVDLETNMSTVEPTLYIGETEHRLAHRHFDFHSDERKMIKKIIKGGKELAKESANISQETKEMLLVNTENLIRQYNKSARQ